MSLIGEYYLGEGFFTEDQKQVLNNAPLLNAFVGWGLLQSEPQAWQVEVSKRESLLRRVMTSDGLLPSQVGERAMLFARTLKAEPYNATSSLEVFKKLGQRLVMIGCEVGNYKDLRLFEGNLTEVVFDMGIVNMGIWENPDLRWGLEEEILHITHDGVSFRPHYKSPRKIDPKLAPFEVFVNSSEFTLD